MRVSLWRSNLQINLYTDRNLNSKILYEFDEEDQVVVLRCDEKWVFVDFDGLQGYLAIFDPNKAEEPAVEEPAVEEPAEEEPAAEEPAAEEPAVEEPAAEEPAVEEPAAEEPAVEEPAAEEPAAEEPAVEEPAAEEPAVEEPAAEEPAAEEPAVEEPAAEEPAAEETPERSVSISANVGNVVFAGDGITLTAVLSGYDDVETQITWQYNDGTGWKDIEGANGLQYTFTLTEATADYGWRVVVDIL
jgi:hypothetical protein